MPPRKGRCAAASDGQPGAAVPFCLAGSRKLSLLGKTQLAFASAGPAGQGRHDLVIVALIIAVASVVGGSALALLPMRHPRVLGPIRTFGLTASAAVVLLHLLPEAYHSHGSATLLAFMAALVLPSALNPLLRTFTSVSGDNGAEWVTLRVTYAGLVVHSVADGIALGAYSGHMPGGATHHDVLIALSAHTIPVVAVTVLTFRDFRGLGFALLGAFGLMIATCSGVIGAGLIPDEIVHEASGWIGAIVAGLLLHVVTHDLGGQRPVGHSERLLDLLAASAGIGVGLLGGEAHSHVGDPHGSHRSLDSVLADIAVEVAPVLLVGLLLAALLQSVAARIPGSWLSPRGRLGSAATGTLIALSFPLSSCSVLPISRAFAERRAAPPLVVAFLLAAPALGVETLAMSIHFFGWEFAGLRLGGALLVAMLPAVVVGMLSPVSPSPSSTTVLPLELGVIRNARMGRRLLSAFDELLDHIGAWVVLGILAAALVGVLVPAGTPSAPGSLLLELVLVSVVAIPAYFCAPAIMPVAAVLIAKGMPASVVLAGLLLGPVANLAVLGFLRGAYGIRALLLGLLAMIAATWGVAFTTHDLVVARGMHVARAASQEQHWFGQFAALLLLALLLRSMWRSGIRAWLAPMLSGKVQHRYGHTHNHPHWEEHAHGPAENPIRASSQEASN